MFQLQSLFQVRFLLNGVRLVSSQGGVMAGWTFSVAVWMLLAAAIYFIGHLQQLKLMQNYRTFYQVMLNVAGHSIPADSCAMHGSDSNMSATQGNNAVLAQEVGSLLPYQFCAQSGHILLRAQDKHAAVLQDLGVAPNQLRTVQTRLMDIGAHKVAFMPFISGLPAHLQLQKRLSVLPYDGNLATPEQVMQRLEQSEQVWGGRVLAARQGFWQYQRHVQSTDGVWREQDDTQWLAPWSTHSPSNHLVPASWSRP